MAITKPILHKVGGAVIHPFTVYKGVRGSWITYKKYAGNPRAHAAAVQ